MPPQYPPQFLPTPEQQAVLDAVDVLEETGIYARCDEGIRDIVRALREGGIETTESCDGSPGHCYAAPTVCFNGTYEAGFRALALCFTFGLPVKALLRQWNVTEGEPVGPEWRLVFWRKEPPHANEHEAVVP